MKLAKERPKRRGIISATFNVRLRFQRWAEILALPFELE
jgi:hypothetical protein